MNQCVRCLVASLAAVGLSASAHVALAQTPASVLPNGSLEEGLTGWQAAVNDPKHVGAAVACDPTQAKHGAKSLKITLPGESHAAVTSPLAPVQAGQDYLLSFWYRSEGFSQTNLYAGVNLQYVLTWLDAGKKAVGGGGMGLSYGAVPQWRLTLNLVTAPAGAAFASLAFPMSVNDKGRPSSVWLDRVQLRPWPGGPKPGGKTWVFPVADGIYQQDRFRRVADDDTSSGFAVLANPRFQDKHGYLAANLYTRAIPPGQYRAVFRLKLGELPAPPQPLLTYDINTDSLGHLTAGAIGTGAFQRAGVYQDIPVRFVLPPGVQWIDPRLNWNGGPATWIDTISIVEEKIFSQDDVRTILE